MKKLNEESARDALMAILPWLDGRQYELQSQPDELNHPERDVDFIFKPRKVATPMLAIEHTVVEAYDGQIAYSHRSYDLAQAINTRCHDQLPADRYFFLVIPERLSASLRGKDRTHFEDLVANQVATAARKLSVNAYTPLDFNGEPILLMCGGSHPTLNRSVGRIPSRPNDSQRRADRLWKSLEHGLAKFAKYRNDQYQTLLSLEDISGSIPGPPTVDGLMTKEQQSLVNQLVDYIIVFVASQQRMIVANVWKEKEVWYDVPPYTRRFSQESGEWAPLEIAP